MSRPERLSSRKRSLFLSSRFSRSHTTATRRYWLPSLLKHRFVALRFVPQAEYEQAAKLDVVPAPDVVLRCFMVFKGIPLNTDSSVSEWQSARTRATDDPGMWQTVVGMPENGDMADVTLFRVLEWGGMEVKV